MITAVLLLVIALLSGLIGFILYQGRIERNKLVNAIISKNATEQVAMDREDKSEPEEVVVKEEPIPEGDLNDDEFEKIVIEKEMNG